jgi:transcriptional regulator with XRE-family HTH domain
MTPAQCRAARALLGITQSELAKLSGLGLSTIVDFERQRRQVSKKAIKSIKNALDQAGVKLDQNTDAETPITSRVEEAVVDLFGPRSPSRYGSYHVDFPRKNRLASAQIRAARALLRWSAQDLARASAVGVNTIRRAEVAEERISLTVANQLAIRRALEGAGVVFIDEDGGGPGVRLREPLKAGVLRR